MRTLRRAVRRGGIGRRRIGCVRLAAPTPPVFDRARAALRYDAQGRRLILPLKHADRTELAATLAPHMARAGAALLREADVLVPVPLHRSRLFQRRYNQAALLAQAVGRIAGRPWVLDALVRRRATASLGEKSADGTRRGGGGSVRGASHRAWRALRASVCCWWMT